MLKDVLGFAQHQEKGTYGLGYKLTLTRNSDNAVLNKGNAINNAETRQKMALGERRSRESSCFLIVFK